MHAAVAAAYADLDANALDVVSIMSDRVDSACVFW